MQKIVIFDMDGTLIDSRKDITISINYIREKNHSLEPVSEDFVVDVINRDERNLAFLFYGTKEYEEKDRKLFEQHYSKQCTQNVFLYENILEVLEKLNDIGVRMFVATNAPTFFAKIMLKHLQIADMFEMIVGADMVKNSKPDPEMIYKILEFTHFEREKDMAWMIGDSSKDMQSAENANIYSIFVTWGFSPKSEYKCNIETPKEILSIVL